MKHLESAYTNTVGKLMKHIESTYTNTWLTLPAELNGAALLAQSIDDVGVAFVPGSAFFADKSGENTIRLSFSLSDESEINEGIRLLGQVIRGA